MTARAELCRLTRRQERPRVSNGAESAPGGGGNLRSQGWPMSKQSTTTSAPARPRSPSDEKAFRELVHQLAGATELNELAQRAVRLATSIPSASYMERVRSDTEVEVVASHGAGAPPVGTVADYPGSLTEALIEQGTPTAIRDIGMLGKAIAPYLKPMCEGCVGLVVPLLAEGAILGCLVLLRSSPSAAFTEEETQHAITIGDLASIGARRALTIAHERQAREQLTATLEAITDGFLALDAEWRVIFANRQARQFGKKNRWVHGRHRGPLDLGRHSGGRRNSARAGGSARDEDARTSALRGPSRAVGSMVGCQRLSHAQPVVRVFPRHNRTEARRRRRGATAPRGNDLG